MRTPITLLLFFLFHAALAQPVDFDTFFAGDTDDDKLRSAIAYYKTKTGPTPEVQLRPRTYTFTIQLPTYSGINWVGLTYGAALEFRRSTIIKYRGAAGTSFLRFLNTAAGETQVGQGYPGDNSPRGIQFRGLLFDGTYSYDWLPKYDINTVDYRGKTCWYWVIRDCGFANWRTVWHGWSTGSRIEGVTHVQGFRDSWLRLGGSETTVFTDTYSFVGSSDSIFCASGKPTMILKLGKSYVGQCMITCRKKSYGVLIEYGSLVVNGLAIDAQDVDPMYGQAVRITSGANGVVLSNMFLKGVMANPPLMGAKGWIEIHGGQQIILQCNTFIRKGNSMAAESAPVVWIGPGVGKGEVKIRYNNYVNFPNGSLIQQAVSNQALFSYDPKVTLTPANTSPVIDPPADSTECWQLIAQ